MAEGGTCQDTERNQPTEGKLTSCRRHRGVLVRTRKETDPLRCTHQLETAEGGSCQDMERNRPTEVHSLPGQREGLVMTRKETDRLRCTHFLDMAEGETCQDMERNRPNEVHSLPGDSRGRDLSGHGKEQTYRSALTNWRRQGEGLVRT